jgi:hypothetical protein
LTFAVNEELDAVATSTMRPLRATSPPAKAEGIRSWPAAKEFVAVTVRTPLVIEAAVDVAELGVGLQVKTNSSLFHHHSNGGERIALATRLAEFNAGFSELPITGLRLKLSRFAHSIVSLINRVEIAMLFVLQFLDY